MKGQVHNANEQAIQSWYLSQGPDLPLEIVLFPLLLLRA